MEGFRVGFDEVFAGVEPAAGVDCAADYEDV